MPALCQSVGLLSRLKNRAAHLTTSGLIPCYKCRLILADFNCIPSCHRLLLCISVVFLTLIM